MQQFVNDFMNDKIKSILSSDSDDRRADLDIVYNENVEDVERYFGILYKNNVMKRICIDM